MDDHTTMNAMQLTKSAPCPPCPGQTNLHCRDGFVEARWEAWLCLFAFQGNSWIFYGKAWEFIDISSDFMEM